MKADELRELKELIEFLKENKIGEFDLERGELKIRIKFAQEGVASLVQALGSAAAQPVIAVPAMAPGAVSAAQAAAAPPGAEAPAGENGEDASLHVVKSPIV